MDIFDTMVEDLLDGGGLVAEFDSGLTLSVYDVDRIGITIEEDDDIIDIVLRGEEVEFLHLFLETLFVAQQRVKNVNWDELLTGTE